MSYTEELLMNGHFDLIRHPELAGDVRNCSLDDPQVWQDMGDVVKRVRSGNSRVGDWDAPIWRHHSDLGEFRLQVELRHYRLYVHGSRAEPNQLVMLHFDWKPDGAAGLNVQDGQIDIACARLASWLTRHL